MADTSPEYALARIEKYTDRTSPRGCWIWTRAVNSNGYPEMHIKPRVVGVHRWLYQHVHGVTLRRDQLCLHRCDTPRCVNPEHIFIGTDGDNHLDMVAKDRHNRGERNRRNKLTEAQALEILANPPKIGKPNSGVAACAKKYGVSDTTILSLVHGKKWKHLHRRMAEGQNVAR